MNLPNKLTTARVILVPVFLAILLWGGYAAGDTAARLCAVVIFCAASLTDFLDGYLARKYKLVTNFGIFMDPIADKLLVSTALIAMTGLSLIPSWVVALIIGREFVISGLRLVASDGGITLSASKWGKAKTVSQMLMIIYVLTFSAFIQPWEGVFYVIGLVLIYASATLTVVSAVDYLIKNGHVLKEKKEKK